MLDAPRANLSRSCTPRRGLADRERPDLELLIAHLSRILDSEIALFYQPDGQGYPFPVISS